MLDGLEIGVGFLVLLASLAVCALLLYASRGAGNLALAGYLASLGLANGLSSLGEVVPSVVVSRGIILVALAGTLAGSFVYLVFLGAALDVPLTRPFRGREPRLALLVLAATAGAAPFLHPEWFLAADPEASTWGGWRWFGTAQGSLALNAVFLVTSLYGLLCTLSALRRAPAGTVARQRAAAYATAFILLDAATALVAALTLRGTGGPLVVALNALALPAATALVIGMLAHGMLRFQLFDLDLRIKWGLQRGTIAALFLAVFLVISQLAQSYLSSSFGWLAGGLVCGALALALRPLEKFAGRVADAAMPDVEPTPAYSTFRKLEVYRAAVETAFENGYGIDARERSTLDKLRAKLAIAAPDAAALESDVAARFAPV